MADIQIINPIIWGGRKIARTIRVSYYKAGRANFMERPDGFGQNAVKYIDNMNSQHIRKLTPSETYRLMDMDEENIQKIVGAKDVDGNQLVSDTRMYATAGNGIVTACLEFIFHNMFICTPEKDKTDDRGQFSLF